MVPGCHETAAAGGAQARSLQILHPAGRPRQGTNPALTALPAVLAWPILCPETTRLLLL
jgi:hypothetical protein